MSSVYTPRHPFTPALCAVSFACLLHGEHVAAREPTVPASAQVRAFDIPAGALDEVLLNIVRQSNTPIAFDQALVKGLRAPAIRGSLSVERALGQALQGSGLGYSRTSDGGWLLRRQGSIDDGAGAQPVSSTTLAAVVVTGTRQTDVKAGESLSPIDVVSTEQLRQTGSTDLRDALVRLLPSLSRQAQAYNASALTNAQSLRGLSPNHVLVLVNGKRRHETANINVSGGLQSGSTGVDLDTIPMNAIDHIEVLRDGASAQYGSDAIAGVINIILKSADHGGQAGYTVGQYGEGDGFSQTGGVNGGLRLGDTGFLNLTAQFREQDNTVRSGVDSRTGRNGNPSIGDPSVHRQALAFNTGAALDDDTDLYSFATYTRRSVSSAQIPQLPSLAPTMSPNGFTPRVTSDEDDYSLTAGARGSDLLGWNWDLSSTYGADRPDIGMDHSINLALYRETGTSPRSFDLARYKTTQWTQNLDLRRDFDLAQLPNPLSVSWGLEQRRELYAVTEGDYYSWYNGGSKALPGQAPSTAGQWSRDVLGGYVELGTALSDSWQVSTAARYEHYSDFGSTTNGKLATRYQINPTVAVRGSISSGFRAPSLAQEHYTSLGVSPTIATGLLAVDSTAARMLGAKDLKPEKSVSFNLGAVITPLPDLDISIDAYRIDIRDRIVDGATYSGQAAIDALLAGGISVPAGLTQVSTHYMTNGADTRTQGVDISASYRSDLQEWGRIDWRLGANFNNTQLQKNHLGSNGQPLLNRQQQAWITSSTPQSQVSLEATWSLDRWAVLLRETRYGKTVSELDYYTGPNAYSTTEFNRFENSPKYLTDVELRFAATRQLSLALGANNLFDVKPDKLPAESTYLGFNHYDTYASQISFNGAFYYLSAVYDF